MYKAEVLEAMRLASIQTFRSVCEERSKWIERGNVFMIQPLEYEQYRSPGQKKPERVRILEIYPDVVMVEVLGYAHNVRTTYQRKEFLGFGCRVMLLSSESAVV